MKLFSTRNEEGKYEWKQCSSQDRTGIKMKKLILSLLILIDGTATSTGYEMTSPIVAATNGTPRRYNSCY